MATSMSLFLKSATFRSPCSRKASRLLILNAPVTLPLTSRRCAATGGRFGIAPVYDIFKAEAKRKNQSLMYEFRDFELLFSPLL